MAAHDLESFRRAFHTGERVSGRVLSRPDALHALVDISGFELLAVTDTDPPPGAVLTFLIARLFPTVVLREITRREGLPGVDPRLAARTLSAFATARTALEVRLAAGGHAFVLPRPPGPGGPPVDLTALKRGFLAMLRRDPAAHAAYGQASRLALELSVLSPAGRVLYAPWYPPGATGHELLLGHPGPGGGRDITLAFRLAQTGEVRIKAFIQADAARYLVFAARPGEFAATVFVPGLVRLGRRTIRLERIGAPRPLAAAAPSLAAALFGGGTGSFTGVNLRV